MKTEDVRNAAKSKTRYESDIMIQEPSVVNVKNAIFAIL